MTSLTQCRQLHALPESWLSRLRGEWSGKGSRNLDFVCGRLTALAALANDIPGSTFFGLQFPTLWERLYSVERDKSDGRPVLSLDHVRPRVSQLPRGILPPSWLPAWASPRRMTGHVEDSLVTSAKVILVWLPTSRHPDMRVSQEQVQDQTCLLNHQLTTDTWVSLAKPRKSAHLTHRRVSNNTRPLLWDTETWDGVSHTKNWLIQLLVNKSILADEAVKRQAGIWAAGTSVKIFD